jgi:pyruvate ferredoxin oxidoreductase gamma subunit
MFRIRFHGRGGQGMKTASRMLGTAFFLSGYEVQDAPRYGAERRGAPIFAFVRAAHEAIAERGVIPEPDLVVVADDTLVGVPAAGVNQGLDAHTVLAINTLQPAALWRERLNISSTVIALPGFTPEDPAERPYVGAISAGAAARLVGVIARDALVQAVHDELAGLPQKVVAQNIERAEAAFDAMAGHAGCVTERAEGVGVAAPGWVTLGLEEATPAVYAGANSVEVRTGLWRIMRPIVDRDLCKRCNWVCGSFCPDSAISVSAEGYPEIDYDHCKGCLICLAQCPPHAIRAVPESEVGDAA